MKLEKSLDSLLEAIEAGHGGSIYLISGELSAAEPQARRLAEALARRFNAELKWHRRPTNLEKLFADIMTTALFDDGKVELVIDSGLFADKNAAADLVDVAVASLGNEKPVTGSFTLLSHDHQIGASRLIKVLKLFGVDPRAMSPKASIEALPKWTLQGGADFRRKHPRGHGSKEVGERMAGLVDLLQAGLDHDVAAFGENDLATLGRILEIGPPARHFLIFAESSVTADHPVVVQFAKASTYVSLPRVTSDKNGWQGLGSLSSELMHELGIGISGDALAELARRTLRQTGDFANRGTDSESATRLAGEYRKLASLAKGQGKNRIEVGLVTEAVHDRGEEDVWQILDALGQGKAEEAGRRYRRLIEGADDEMAARLSFFSLLASFGRQLVAVGGMARLERVPAGLRNYNQFKEEWAPRLQKDPPHGGKNPLAGLHPYRLHRAYLLACLLGRDELLELPWRVLETEMRVKGESSEADAAVGLLLTRLASRPSSRS